MCQLEWYVGERQNTGTAMVDTTVEIRLFPSESAFETRWLLNEEGRGLAHGKPPTITAVRMSITRPFQPE
jgi:hypothetical protein